MRILLTRLSLKGIIIKNGNGNIRAQGHGKYIMVFRASKMVSYTEALPFPIRPHPVVQADVLSEIEVETVGIASCLYECPGTCDPLALRKDDQGGEHVDALHGP
jgi:hypothetical protein